jgi:ribosomal protein L12E/L44/L45/RPP1/RPP2
MKFAAAYLLCVLGGKDPTKENLEALLGSVGIDWEKRGDDLLASMEGKDLAEVLAAGEELLVKGGGGGGGGGGGA